MVELRKLIDAQYKKQRNKTITLLRTAKSTNFLDLKGTNSKRSGVLYASLTHQPPIPTLEHGSVTNS